MFYIQELKTHLHHKHNSIQIKQCFQQMDQFLDFSLKNQEFLGNLVDDILDYVQITENKDKQLKLYIV